jgi:hypothetical protein
MLASNLFSRVPDRYWTYFALAIWGGLALAVLRGDAYGLDEWGARALLLVWSVSDQVASGVLTLGAPDFRALLLAPVAILWTGKVFAAKVFAVLLVAAAARLFYLGRERTGDAESALLSTGLLLLSPLTLYQIDGLAPGPFLLLMFVAGGFLDQAYRANPRPFGGWYFAQLLVTLVAVSLHPAGLAYPAALLWAWYRNPIDKKQQFQFYAGTIFVVVFALLFGMGWSNLDWFHNPLSSLAEIALGASVADAAPLRWIVGSVTLLMLIAVAATQFRHLWADFTGRVLLTGSLLGAISADGTWGMVVLATLLYGGFPLLLRRSAVAGGFLRQRGAAMLVLLVLSTVFMISNRAHYQFNQQGELASQDRLIATLSEKAASAKKAADADEDGKAVAHFRVASQWPGRTMIACRCDTLPLPPAAKDAEGQLLMLRSISYLLFDPQDSRYAALARNIALLGGGVAETIALQRGAVIVHFPQHDAIEPNAAPPSGP